jgi:hypothetical protein
MSRFLSVVFSQSLSVVSLLSFSLILGCQPRGETKSLPEIVQTAQARYRSALDGSSFPEKVDERLSALADDLQGLLDGQRRDKKQKISSVIANLRKLTAAAGYTSRPAFGELTNQFVGLEKQDTINENSLGLLVARTFFLLASELEGVRFQLYEREQRQ